MHTSRIESLDQPVAARPTAGTDPAHARSRIARLGDIPGDLPPAEPAFSWVISYLAFRWRWWKAGDSG